MVFSFKAVITSTGFEGDGIYHKVIRVNKSTIAGGLGIINSGFDVVLVVFWTGMTGRATPKN